jgi:hypothetical protein
MCRLRARLACRLSLIVNLSMHFLPDAAHAVLGRMPSALQALANVCGEGAAVRAGRCAFGLAAGAEPHHFRFPPTVWIGVSFCRFSNVPRSTYRLERSDAYDLSDTQPGSRERGDAVNHAEHTEPHTRQGAQGPVIATSCTIRRRQGLLSRLRAGCELGRVLAVSAPSANNKTSLASHIL